MRKDHPSADDIRDSLKRLCKEPELARSPQLVEFLTYVVEKTLSGDESRLKAYSVATEVFGRDSNFDPQTDSIVRVQARRLRTALAEFYRRDHVGVKVHISLPVGGYVPRFDWVENGEPVVKESNRFESNGPPVLPRRERATTWQLIAAVTIAALLVIGAFLYLFWPVPPPSRDITNWGGRPVVIVTAFTQTDQSAQYDAGIFQTLLVQRLSNYTGIEVRMDSEEAASDAAELAAELGIVYQLGGQIEMRSDGIDAHVVVTRKANSEVIWSHGFSMPISERTHDEALRQLATTVATNVVAFRGDVRANARERLPNWAFSGADALLYACGSLYRDGLGPSRAFEREQSRRCFEGRLDANPQRPFSRAVIATLDALDVQSKSTPADDLGQLLLEEVAIGADVAGGFPGADQAHELYGRILWAANDIDGARREFLAALDANPANSDVEASLGIMEVLAGNADAVHYVESAINRDMWPAGWYFTIRALDCLRHNDHSGAINYALRLLPDDVELGLTVLVATAPHADRSDLVDAYAPALLALPQFAPQGIMARLSMRIKDESILDMLRTDLLAAGIPQSYLNEGYERFEWPP